MGIGDNFDTSSRGLINQKTGRMSGDHVTDIFLPGYNGGHPCNIGCGCHEKCDNSVNSGFGCLLPEELVITITQGETDGNRQGARVRIGAYQGDTYFLKYSNGAWRGRKCCTSLQTESGSFVGTDPISGIGPNCDPCDVTTVDLPGDPESVIGKPSFRSDCSYAGITGTTDYAASNISAGRAGDNTPVPIDNPNCLRDGEIPPRLPSQCMGADGRVFCGGYCSGPDPDDSDETIKTGDNKEDCLAKVDENDNKTHAWTDILCTEEECIKKAECTGSVAEESQDEFLKLNETECNLTEGCSWDPVRGVCFGAPGTCPEPDSFGNDGYVGKTNPENPTNEWECLAAGGDWYPRWVRGEFDASACCGGYVITDHSASHQPQISGITEGEASKDKLQATCITPYKEAILLPGSSNTGVSTTPGGTDGCEAIQNAWERTDTGSSRPSGTGNYFTLILRGCNYHGNCTDRAKTSCVDYFGEDTDHKEKQNCEQGAICLDQTDRDDIKRAEASTEEECNKLKSNGKDVSWHYNEWSPELSKLHYSVGDAGLETVLYIPIDQMLNCSDFDLTLGSQTVEMESGDKVSLGAKYWGANRWFDGRGDIEGNPAGFYPGTYNYDSTAPGGLRADNLNKSKHVYSYTQWCSSPDQNLDGVDDRLADPNPEARIYGFSGQAGGCRSYVYYENAAGITAGFNRIDNPKGHYQLRALNIHPQPFKTTEQEQKTHKTYDEAVYDSQKFSGCVEFGYWTAKCLDGSQGTCVDQATGEETGDVFEKDCLRRKAEGQDVRWTGRKWGDCLATGGLSGCPFDIEHGYDFWFENDLKFPAGENLYEEDGLCHQLGKQVYDYEAGHIGKLQCGANCGSHAVWPKFKTWHPVQSPNCGGPEVFMEDGSPADEDNLDGLTDSFHCIERGYCTSNLDDPTEITGETYGECGKCTPTVEGGEFPTQGECTDGTCSKPVDDEGEPNANQKHCEDDGGTWTVNGTWSNEGLWHGCDFIPLTDVYPETYGPAELTEEPRCVDPGSGVTEYYQGSQDIDITCTEDMCGNQEEDEDGNYVWYGCENGEWITGLLEEGYTREYIEGGSTYRQEGGFGDYGELGYCVAHQPTCIDNEVLPSDLSEIIYGFGWEGVTTIQPKGECIVLRSKGVDPECKAEDCCNRHECSVDDITNEEDCKTGTSDQCLDENNLEMGHVTEESCLSYKGDDGEPIYRWVAGEEGEWSQVTKWKPIDSLDYWGRTGLYPSNTEPGISHVADSCVGTTRYGRVEMASNTKPVIIRSKDHLLEDGDKVETTGILGNFKANRMTVKDWGEMVWEDKDGAQCDDVAHCGNQVWPSAKCQPEKDGTCKHKVVFVEASCSEKDSDGEPITDEDKCDEAEGDWIDEVSQETCYDGKDEFGKPLPAPWFVVKKYDKDLFKLYTCDGEPLDGTVNRSAFTSCDLEGSGDMVCGSSIATEDALRPTCPCNYVLSDEESPRFTAILKSDEIELDSFGHCVAYGECAIVLGGNPPGTNPEAMMQQHDCHRLAKDYVTYDPSGGSCKSRPICFEKETGDIVESISRELCEEHQDYYWVPEVALEITTPTECVEEGGGWHGAESQLTNKGTCQGGSPRPDSSGFYECEKAGGEWQTEYNPCVITRDDGSLDTNGCWSQFKWANKSSFAGESTEEVGSWATCPYTGEWVISNATGNMTPYDHSLNVYRDGWDGTGTARLDLPNMSDNFYVQVEQKENCPVCADHFMPNQLMATITPTDTTPFRFLKSGFSRCRRSGSGSGETVPAHCENEGGEEVDVGVEEGEAAGEEAREKCEEGGACVGAESGNPIPPSLLGRPPEGPNGSLTEKECKEIGLRGGEGSFEGMGKTEWISHTWVTEKIEGSSIESPIGLDPYAGGRTCSPFPEVGCGEVAGDLITDCLNAFEDGGMCSKVHPDTRAPIRDHDECIHTYNGDWLEAPPLPSDICELEACTAIHCTDCAKLPIKSVKPRDEKGSIIDPCCECECTSQRCQTGCPDYPTVAQFEEYCGGCYNPDVHFGVLAHNLGLTSTRRDQIHFDLSGGWIVHPRFGKERMECQKKCTFWVCIPSMWAMTTLTPVIAASICTIATIGTIALHEKTKEPTSCLLDPVSVANYILDTNLGTGILIGTVVSAITNTISICNPVCLHRECWCRPCTGYPHGRADICEPDFIHCQGEHYWCNANCEEEAGNREGRDNKLIGDCPEKDNKEDCGAELGCKWNPNAPGCTVLPLLITIAAHGELAPDVCEDAGGEWKDDITVDGEPLGACEKNNCEGGAMDQDSVALSEQCYEDVIDVRAGCPGLVPIDLPMTNNGGYWATNWHLMGEAEGENAQYVGGMNFFPGMGQDIIPAHCEDHAGEKVDMDIPGDDEPTGEAAIEECEEGGTCTWKDTGNPVPPNLLPHDKVPQTEEECKEIGVKFTSLAGDTEWTPHTWVEDQRDDSTDYTGGQWDPDPEESTLKHWGISCSLHDWNRCCRRTGACYDHCGGKISDMNISGAAIDKAACEMNTEKLGWVWHEWPTKDIPCHGCDCGACKSANVDRGYKRGLHGLEFNGFGGPPTPEPYKDGHFIRLNLACSNGAPIPGDGLVTEGNARFNLTGDYYHNNQLGLSWEITTCSFPPCFDPHYKPPCPYEHGRASAIVTEEDFGCTDCSQIAACVKTPGECSAGRCIDKNTGDTIMTGEEGERVPADESNCMAFNESEADGPYYVKLPDGTIVERPAIEKVWIMGDDPIAPSKNCKVYGEVQKTSGANVHYSVDSCVGVPSYNCGGTPPCIECCSMFKEGYTMCPTQGIPPHSHAMASPPECFGKAISLDDYYPDWWYAGENMIVYHVDMDGMGDDGIRSRGYDILTVQLSDTKCCEGGPPDWPKGTVVSTGKSDRTPVETGKSLDYSRNATSKNPSMGLGATKLMESIPIGGTRHHSGFYAIKVEDASIFRSGNAALDRHLQRRRDSSTGACTLNKETGGKCFDENNQDTGFTQEDCLSYKDENNNPIHTWSGDIEEEILDDVTEKECNEKAEEGKCVDGNGESAEATSAEDCNKLKKDDEDIQWEYTYIQEGDEAPDWKPDKIAGREVFEGGRFDYIDGDFFRNEAYPYGLSPWPIAHQNVSSVPSASIAANNTLESLREPFRGLVIPFIGPGRIGLIPNAALMQKLGNLVLAANPPIEPAPQQEATPPGATDPADADEPAGDAASGDTTPEESTDKLDEIAEEHDIDSISQRYRKLLEIISIENRYDDEGNFRYIEVKTGDDHDLKTGEKIIISAAATYEAKCVDPNDDTTRPGSCYIDEVEKITLRTKQECEDADGTWNSRIPDLVKDSDLDAHLCESLFEGAWKTDKTWKEFEEGCTAHCQLGAFVDDSGMHCTSEGTISDDGTQSGHCPECPWIEEDEYRCPESVVDGSHVAVVIDKRSFSIHYEKHIDFEDFETSKRLDSAKTPYNLARLGSAHKNYVETYDPSLSKLKKDCDGYNSLEVDCVVLETEESCLNTDGCDWTGSCIRDVKECTEYGHCELNDDGSCSMKLFPINTTDDSELWASQFPAGRHFGHEMGVGPAKNIFKGVIYNRNMTADNVTDRLSKTSGTCLDENDQDTGYVTQEDCLSYKDESNNPIYTWSESADNCEGWDPDMPCHRTYQKFNFDENAAIWSRHGGLFDITIGGKTPRNDCHQMNSSTPTNLEYYVMTHESCCNIFQPLRTYECGPTKKSSGQAEYEEPNPPSLVEIMKGNIVRSHDGWTILALPTLIGGRTPDMAIDIQNKWWTMWYNDQPTIGAGSCYEGYGPRRPLPRWDNSALFKINITDVIPVSSDEEEGHCEDKDGEKVNMEPDADGNEPTGEEAKKECEEGGTCTWKSNGFVIPHEVVPRIARPLTEEGCKEVEATLEGGNAPPGTYETVWTPYIWVTE